MEGVMKELGLDLSPYNRELYISLTTVFPDEKPPKIEKKEEKESQLCIKEEQGTREGEKFETNTKLEDCIKTEEIKTVSCDVTSYEQENKKFDLDSCMKKEELEPINGKRSQPIAIDEENGVVSKHAKIL